MVDIPLAWQPAFGTDRRHSLAGENKETYLLQTWVWRAWYEGGGCGKTTLILHILRPLLAAPFGADAVQLAAPSNKAA